MELKPFTLAVKNPMKSIIELCLNLSSNEAVLPVLVTLMLHCKGDREKSNFQVSFQERRILYHFVFIVNLFLCANVYRTPSLIGFYQHLLEADLQGMDLASKISFFQVRIPQHIAYICI